VVFHTTVDMMAVLRDLIAEGWTITAGDLAVLSPYLTARIQRFGVYATDEIALTPAWAPAWTCRRRTTPHRVRRGRSCPYPPC
jgi:hypothetical protein